MTHIYYNPKTNNVYIVPNHYCHTLAYIEEALNWAKEKGLTIPTNKKNITIQILAGIRHRRMLSIEFKSSTKPNYDYIDLDKYPHMFEYLKY